ncbi:MAG: hypothetical protein LBC45_06070 [Chlamydiales bacterium]|jgi:hypothetical protein|nr:hypothetical protein [Chlamydiales bacterium]
MGKLKDEIARLAGTNFFRLAKKESHPRIRIKLLALDHLDSGKTKTEVAKKFQITFPTLRAYG